ncbi:g5000 [Coccomyxa viridis]|uniref:G5000 protein n=1 Tax=Coccomyxa viridis TaxID=1274662 RepID=A0ABP1FWT4_9CHLO
MVAEMLELPNDLLLLIARQADGSGKAMGVEQDTACMQTEPDHERTSVPCPMRWGRSNEAGIGRADETAHPGAEYLWE